MRTYTRRTFIQPALVILTLLVLLPVSAVHADETASSTAVSIHLDIVSATTTLFSNTLVVSECASSASSTPTVTAYCAVKQSGLDSTWSEFGGSQFLSSIAGVSNDYSTNIYWNWFANLEYGQTSLDQHILTADERLLITIGRLPLKIAVSTTSPQVGSTTVISVSEFGFDASWNGVWLPAASSSVHVGDDVYAVTTNGQYELVVATTSPIALHASKEQFINSDSLTLTPVLSAAEEASSTDSAPDQAPAGSGAASGGSSAPCTVDVSRAFAYLATQQKPDGSFGSGLYTDWAAIALALGPASATRDRILTYEKNFTGALSGATDYERHAMALMALGVDPYTGTQINYIQKIIDQFDGTQIGDRSLVNDDIFALIPLMRAGYTTQDQIIQAIGAFVIQHARADGSWEGSIDLTAAGIQALSLVASLPGATQAMSNARAYLNSHQQNDGGFGSSFATSWALQAIAARGESYTSWTRSGHTPYDALCALQQSDGGFEPTTAAESSRVWATSYAIPAALNRSWPSILPAYSRPVQSVSAVSGAASVVAASSTPTAILATSSPVVLTEATTTAVHVKAPTPVVRAAVHVEEMPVTHAAQDVAQAPAESAARITPQTAAVADADPGGRLPILPVAAGMAGVVALSVGLYSFISFKK